ncbi:Rho guanine nucleotide exchange factor [Marasmius tenuissimus]|nr:Rho guanine nucleotide exchange factor [Marasmius tenuissimus]
MDQDTFDLIDFQGFDPSSSYYDEYDVHSRPSSESDVDLRNLVQAVIDDEEKYRKLLESRGDEAQRFLDALQVLVDLPTTQPKLRSSMVKMMLRLSERSGLCPSCLNLENVERVGNRPVAGGGFADVWKGRIKGQLVCLKVVKVYHTSDVQELLKAYMREAIVWQQLRHPNLLPFLGMYYLDEAREELCLVSPWMNRGNLCQYLKNTPRESVDHQALAYDIASGLAHLHDMKIVHGDLKGVNVLVTPDERASIGDFGLSRVAETHSLHLSTSATGHGKGTTRWLSPELLRSDPPCSTSANSDLYAYACVCYEVFVGRVPYYELLDGAVIVAVLFDKKLPSRPTGLSELTDPMWKVMASCWNHDPQLRPTAKDVLTLVGSLSSPKTGLPIEAYAAPKWDATSQTLLRQNVQHPSIDLTVITRLLTSAGIGVSTTAIRAEQPLSDAECPTNIGAQAAPNGQVTFTFESDCETTASNHWETQGVGHNFTNFALDPGFDDRFIPMNGSGSEFMPAPGKRSRRLESSTCTAWGGPL